MTYRKRILKTMWRLNQELKKEGKKVIHAEILRAEKFDENETENEE